MPNINFLLEHSLLAASKRGQMPVGFIVVTIAILLTVGLAIGAYFMMRNRQPTAKDQSRSLLRELCRTHQLTNAQSHLIQRLADGLGLKCAATLFVDSTAWHIPEGKAEGGLDRKDWEKLQIIQKMLFMPATALPK